MKINLASPLQFTSFIDGPGIRTVIWLQGCPHNCHGCHNPNTHDLKGGYQESIENIIQELKSKMNRKFQSGITISGGDPFFQPESLRELLRRIREELPWCNIWVYTGYQYEYLVENYRDIVEKIDVIVDGKFEEELLCTGKERFKGSSNQRIIKVAESLESEKIIEWR